MSTRNERIAVYGAGVAGLATACALTRSGFRVSLYERTVEQAGPGMGFLLMENGLAALKVLGLRERALAEGVIATASSVREPHGTEIRRKSFAPHLGISRLALLSMLKDGVPAEHVFTGRAFRTFEPIADGVHLAILDDGRSVEADLHVGADGLHSTVRKHLAAGSVPRPSGIAELVSSITAPDIVEALGSTLLQFRAPASGLGVGIVATSPTTLLWYLTHDLSRWTVEDTAAGRRALAQNVADWAWPLPALVERTNFERAYLWRTADMDPLGRPWQDDVVLVGDAAHPLLPFSTQGVNTALVDAATLGTALMAQGVCAAALDRWAQSRSTAAIFLRYGRDRARFFIDPHNSSGEPSFPEDAVRHDIEAMQPPAVAAW